MPQYWIRVTRDSQSNVISLYSPDLQSELLEYSSNLEDKSLENSEDIEIKTDFRLYTQKMLISRFENTNKVILPKAFNQLEHRSLNALQHWEPFEVNLAKKRGACSKMLPGAGHVFNVLAILTGAFITYMALNSVSSRENNSINSSTILSILGAVFSSLIGFSIYIVSDSSNALIETGHRIDNFFKRDDPTQLTRRKSHLSFTFNHFSAKYITLSLVAGGSVVANLTILGIRQYQEVILLTDRYLALNKGLTSVEREQYAELIKWLVTVPNIIASSYCLLAFQGVFARDLVVKVVTRESGQNQNTQDRMSPLLESGNSNSTLSNRLKEVTDDLLIQENESREDLQVDTKEPLLFLRENRVSSSKKDQLELLSNVERNKSPNQKGSRIKSRFLPCSLI